MHKIMLWGQHASRDEFHSWTECHQMENGGDSQNPTALAPWASSLRSSNPSAGAGCSFNVIDFLSAVIGLYFPPPYNNSMGCRCLSDVGREGGGGVTRDGEAIAAVQTATARQASRRLASLRSSGATRRHSLQRACAALEPVFG